MRILFHMLASSMAVLGVVTTADAQTVDVFAAGSLRGAMVEIGRRAAAVGIEIRPVFGGSGTLRDRIEKGEKPDLLLSADMAAPMALAAQGRAVVPPLPFARNRLCLVARHGLGLSSTLPPARLVERLLSPDVRIRTSRPVADPSGDYAMAMFDLMDRVHPGAGRILHQKAALSWDMPAPSVPAGQNANAAMLKAGSVDAAVTYCSATADIRQADLDVLPVPAPFDPHPLFGLAVLSDKGAAARLALLLLSPPGQDALASAGLIPLSGEPPRS